MEKRRWVSAVVAIVGLAIVIALYSFNKQHYVNDEYLLTNIAALFWLPMMLIFLVFREDPTDFGFAAGDTRRGYVEAAILYAVLLPFLFYASRNTNYQAYYPMDTRAMTGFSELIRFELVYGVYLFCWEFFFRGFLLFGFKRTIGFWSVFAQAIPFGIMHYGKPESIWSYGSGLILGILAWRSKSFMPCFVLHWAISITFDVLVILAKRGSLF